MNQAITASAFLHKNGKLFVAKRADKKKFLPGVWELPGGHIEFGEDIKAGLAREFKEEFGIDVIVGDAIHAFTYINRSKNTHSVEVDFLVKMKNQSQKICINPLDHSEYKFVDLQEALAFWPENDPERVAVQKGFERISQLSK